MATNISTDTVTTSNVVVSPQTNKPGSPVEGQIISGDGTGNIAKGVYQYGGNGWQALDNAQGDLNTLRLILSTDTNAVNFAAALNSTSTLAGNTNAVPYETSTGTAMLGALDIPSTGGDALLTEFDADRVFRYYSAGANNNNDYFGITVDIPAWCRGQNIVIEFQYRTEEASDAVSNGDFQLSVWDKSNGVTTTSTNTSTVAAGSAITVGTSTDMAVGDRIWLESGGESTVGNVAATFTEAYITEVVNSTSIKISADYTPSTAAGSAVVSGWLSSKVEGLLPSADSDTDKIGKSFSLQVKTADDTEQIVLWLSNKSVTTNVIELFFDGILISANKFLQASSQTKSEYYGCARVNNFWDTSTANDQWDFDLLNPGPDTPILAESKLITIDDYNGDTQTRIYAKQNIILAASVFATPSNSCWVSVFDSTDNHLQLTHAAGDHAGVPLESSTTIKLAKDDYIYFYQNNSADRYGAAQIVATPQTSDVILLESQDEIFTDWVSDGTFTSHVTASGTDPTFSATAEADAYHWRRVGGNMEIMINFYQSAAGTGGGTGNYFVALPSGYSIDTSKLELDTGYGGTSSLNMKGGATGVLLMGGRSGSYSVFSYGSAFPISATQFGIAMGPMVDDNSSSYGDTGNMWGFTNTGNFAANLTYQIAKGVISIPIQGWNANFNPLLSMPLVEIGANKEEGLWETAAGYGTAATKTQYFTNETYNQISLLGAVVNDSTDGWKFTASQRVKVNAVQVVASDSAGAYWGWSLNSTSITTDITSLTFANGRRVVQGNMGANYIQTIPINLVMEPGDVLRPQGGASTINLGSYQSMQLVVEKDFSNTNMAHIIKPAVAIISNTQAAYDYTEGKFSAANVWDTRVLNTIKGESWFINSLSSNIFELQAGTYKVFAQAPFWYADESNIHLLNTTTGDVQVQGVKGQRANLYSTASAQVANLHGLFTITSAQSFKIEQIADYAHSTDTNQLGYNAAGAADSGETIFTTVVLEKLK